MNPALERPRKTLADLMALGDEARAELIRGEVYVTPSPSEPHQRVVLAVGSMLLAHARETRTGRAYVAPFDVHLPSGDVLQPDVLFVRTTNSALEHRGVIGVPDLVIEVLSPGQPVRDRVVKRDLYAENGVPEYWIVDPDEQTLEVFRLEAQAYRPEGYLTGAKHAVASPTLAGLTVAWSDLFA